MALSLDSKIKDIMRSEEGKAVLEKWGPGSTTNPQMKLVGAMSLRKMLTFPQSAVLAEHAEEIDNELKNCAK